jgi:hypothetical protein
MAAAPPLPARFEESARLRLDVEAELERVCASPDFKTSRRSCQFLRYVVRVALDGREDSLKERSIGMDLLCRDVSYDPSSDATVRVRANDVRKRLASFYRSAPPAGGVSIALATGTYVPSFIYAEPVPECAPSEASLIAPKPVSADLVVESPKPRIRFLFAVGLALIVCLVGVLLWRKHQQQDEYLRFWDHILAGKKVLLLSTSDQDRSRLAPGLFPVVWIAGKFGVPAVLTSGSLTGATTATFAKVRISTMPPMEWSNELELHWILNAGATPRLTTRNSDGHLTSDSFTHAALLTILPDSPSILYVQSTDEDALRKVFETLTLSAQFPGGLVRSASGPVSLQVLLSVDSMGRSTVRTWESR